MLVCARGLSPAVSAGEVPPKFFNCVSSVFFGVTLSFVTNIPSIEC